jgi:methionyl-tRNA formyltransferase
MKIVLLAGAFYNGLFEILERSRHEYKIILHRANPPGTNDLFFQHGVQKNSDIIENSAQLMAKLNELAPDVIISTGWRKILKPPFFNSFKNIKIINVHPAILPDYKGYHTEPYVIMNNEKEHGITAHFLTEELDAGDIILQMRFPINEFSTVKSIKMEIAKIAPAFFERLFQLIDLKEIASVKQVGVTKIIAPKRIPEDSKIDPRQTLEELYHSIRACDADDYPAYFYYNNEKIFIRVWTKRAKTNNLEI